jgi:hypothetical protein
MSTFVAAGNIIRARFVRLDTTSGASGKVVQAVAGENVIGVAAQWSRNPPVEGLDTNLTAIAGENVRVYTAMQPDDCPLIEVDAAYIQGTLLKPSTNGIATATVTNLDIVGAELLEQSTAANQLVKCRVMAPYNLST